MTKPASYTVALYLRLSLEDNDAKTKVESDSIANQRLLLLEYLKSQEDLKDSVVIEKIDDGFSGRNFDRPAVKELLDMVAERKVDCIIVKDLSRFGRNYIEVGNYLEQVFPFLGVRFIAVNDDYDSKDPACVGNLVSVFKTMFHDIYCKDLSVKVKTGKETRARRGEYINAFPPYGYVKSEDNYHKLTIDAEAAAVVRCIFHNFVGGKRKIDIAKELNAQAVLAPMLYQEKNHGNDLWTSRFDRELSFWTDGMVGRILRDMRYKGAVVYGRRSVTAVASKLQRVNPKSKWIVADEMHEGVVSAELFDTAQSMIKDVTVFSNAYKRPAIDRKIKCGGCGHVLLRGGGSKPNYYCETKRFTDKFGCEKSIVLVKDVKEALLISIQKQAQQAVDMEKLILAAKQKSQAAFVDKVEEIKRCETGIDRFTKRQRSLFEAMTRGEVTKEYRAQESLVLAKQREDLEQRLQALQEEKELMEAKCNCETDPFICNFKEHLHIETLTDSIVEKLVETIHVYTSDSIEIVFKFRNEQQRIIELLAAT